jgi:hypothetical protein
MILIPHFNGRLGNVLFEFASCYGLAKDNKRKLVIWWHTLDTRYRTAVCKKWFKYHRNIRPTELVNEHFLQPIQLSNSETILVGGYLQNYNYFWNYRQEICDLLTFDTSVSNKYPLLSESAFIHVRGGDYRNHPLHFVDLSKYYPSAISTVGAPHYYIFTDDKEYLSQQGWLSTIKYTIVDENEFDSMYLMSQCKKGAICPNSTFSWWGAFLDTDRPICMPSRWLNDPRFYVAGYFFPGVTVLEV